MDGDALTEGHTVSDRLRDSVPESVRDSDMTLVNDKVPEDVRDCETLPFVRDTERVLNKESDVESVVLNDRESKSDSEYRRDDDGVGICDAVGRTLDDLLIFRDRLCVTLDVFDKVTMSVLEALCDCVVRDTVRDSEAETEDES